jgi:zona occludens toxin (predicted ATPase)
MISAIVGLPGEGKSLYASIRIREDLKAGRTVYTNLHCLEKNPKYHYFDTEDWEIIFNLHDGVIYFDEGQFILDARNWINLPVKFRELLQKGRHEGLDFICLTQHIMQIDVAYRRLIYESKQVYRIFSKKKWNFGIFLIMDADIQQENEIKNTGFSDLLFCFKKDWEYYNSFALRSDKPPIEDQKCDCGLIHKISTHKELQT